jgi:hypothetical protein
MARESLIVGGLGARVFVGCVGIYFSISICFSGVKRAFRGPKRALSGFSEGI